MTQIANRAVPKYPPNPLPPPNPAYATDTEISVNTLYYTLQGVQQIPVAGSTGTPAQFAQWSAPTSCKEILFIVTRIGGIPDLPEPEPTDPNEVLLDVQLTPCMPTILPSGQQVYHVMGRYRYGLTLPVSKESGYKMGALPFASFSKSANTITQANFKNMY